MSGHRCRNCDRAGHRADGCTFDKEPRFCEACSKLLRDKENGMCWACYRRNGPFGGNGRHIAHCSHCGDVGHNITTCKRAKEAQEMTNK